MHCINHFTFEAIWLDLLGTQWYRWIRPGTKPEEWVVSGKRQIRNEFNLYAFILQVETENMDR